MWHEVPTEEQNGIITGYTITYQSQTENDNGIVVAGPDDRQKNLTNIHEYVIYNITVFASTVKGNGPASNPIVVRTDQDGEFSMSPNMLPGFCIKLLHLPVITGDLKFGQIYRDYSIKSAYERFLFTRCDAKENSLVRCTHTLVRFFMHTNS